MKCILALDVSLCNLGWAVVRLNDELLEVGVIETAKSSRKVWPTHDLVRRILLLDKGLFQVHMAYDLIEVVAELPEGGSDHD